MVNKRQKNFRLLGVDPSPSLRAVLGQLGEDCGMTVTLCASVGEARAALAGEVFDLVVSAADFPDGHYPDLLADVRNQAEMATTPVLLLLGGRNEVVVVQDALDKGITDVFFKRDMDDLARYLESFGTAIAAQKGRMPAGSRALAVEDDRTLGTYYKALLTRHGFVVDHVPSGEAALWEAEHRRYDFILVDLVLGSGCSGIQFLRRLRQPGMASRQAVAIAISSYEDEARRLEALRASANAFMTKPLNERELAAIVEGTALRMAPQESAQPAADAAAETHPCHRCEPCQLTPRESNICALVATGYSDKRIAEEMGVSYWTVRTHIAHAFKKCDVVNRVELVRRLQGG